MQKYNLFLKQAESLSSSYNHYFSTDYWIKGCNQEVKNVNIKGKYLFLSFLK